MTVVFEMTSSVKFKNQGQGQADSGNEGVTLSFIPNQWTSPGLSPAAGSQDIATVVVTHRSNVHTSNPSQDNVQRDPFGLYDRTKQYKVTIEEV